MAEWPSAEELKTVLNLEGWDEQDVRDTTTVPRALATAIDYVKIKRGRWVEGTDAPDEALANAALRMGMLLILLPSGTGGFREPDELREDPAFRASMYGRRQRFGFS